LDALDPEGDAPVEALEPEPEPEPEPDGGLAVVVVAVGLAVVLVGAVVVVVSLTGAVVVVVVDLHPDTQMVVEVVVGRPAPHAAPALATPTTNATLDTRPTHEASRSRPP
jgi:hypothetical protein